MIFNSKKLANMRDNPDEIISMIENKDVDFENYLETFLSTGEAKSFCEKSYDIGIITVGFSIYPLLFSLKAINPKQAHWKSPLWCVMRD